MINEELEHKARVNSLVYDTKYAEDGVLEEMLSRPQDFVDGAIMEIVQLLREKANRDGFIAGAKEIMQKLIDNAPNTYSGTSIELQQKKMFSFQDAVNKAEQLLNSEVEK